MAETLTVLKNRRSTRAYKPELIEEDKLNTIIEAGTYAAALNKNVSMQEHLSMLSDA